MPYMCVYNKVLRELEHTIYVEDPLAYTIDKRIVNSIIERKYHLVSFFKGSYADKNIMLLEHYWKKVDYQYLPKKKRGTDIVWYEFIGKHIQIVN